ncbi:MAG: type II toxin-antitoxin system VapC family toxin [Asticcacaulis sp.]
MMIVDSSALMAITQNEITADRCAECLQHSDDTLMSAVALAEVLVVAQKSRRRISGARPD